MTGGPTPGNRVSYASPEMGPSIECSLIHFHPRHKYGLSWKTSAKLCAVGNGRMHFFL